MDRKIATFLCLFTLLNTAQAEKAKPTKPNTVDHAGLMQAWDEASLKRGQTIYNNLCVNCHGADGRTPSLQVARAFGTGELKFGTDPFSMFRTLTDGNGLMGPQTWMTPRERYDVIHFIREQFMKPLHPGFKPLAPEYLAGLPKAEAAAPEAGDQKQRDFGPALASQLGRDIPSVLSVRLGGEQTISYNLHSMDQAGVWRGGFLDLKQTQHFRERGEGVALPGGELIPGLQTWRWAHANKLDYPTGKLLPRGPMPAKWMEYRGHYLHDDSVVLSYTINGTEILESPSKAGGFGAIVHTLQIGPVKKPLQLAVAQLPSGSNKNGFLSPDAATAQLDATASSPADRIVVLEINKNGQLGQFAAAAIHGQAQGLTWSIDDKNRAVLTIPAGNEPRRFQVVRYSGNSEAELLSLAGYVRLLKLKNTMPDLAKRLAGGKPRWPSMATTKGALGQADAAYTLDTLTLPRDSPGNVWFRTTALAFFPDGRMVVSTHGGDIWIVSGIDAGLANLQWRRFAAGLYEPFGLQVADNKVYVTCKDRLTRLHDVNNDGEADFYESFSADTDVSTFFHAYNFDLQHDTKGNFYYVKAGQYTSHALPGAVIKVSANGKKRTVHSTGFRTPNGMGILPNNRLTVSDNQGSWMPASKVSLLKPGGFYGYVQTHAHGKRFWAPDGGRIDHKKVVPPKTFDQPIIWMPQHFDNSSGGQLWVDDQRWGPLSGRLLHTSFGKGWLYYMMLQEVDGHDQAAIVKLKIDALTGIHRARVNPSDGQVYAVGLNGWNGNGRRGLSQGHVHRFRYTGKHSNLLLNTTVLNFGIELKFNFKLDPTTATDPANYRLLQWNYKWSHGYGSKQYAPKTGEVGQELVTIQAVQLADNGESVFLKIPDIAPVNQMEFNLTLKAADGSDFNEQVYLTINKVPGKELAAKVK